MPPTLQGEVETVGLKFTAFGTMVANADSPHTPMRHGTWTAVQPSATMTPTPLVNVIWLKPPETVMFLVE